MVHEASRELKSLSDRRSEPVSEVSFSGAYFDLSRLLVTKDRSTGVQTSLSTIVILNIGLEMNR